MADPSLGGNSFIRLIGGLNHQAETLQDITRNNVNGVAYKKRGKRAAPSTFQCIALSTAATVASKLTTYFGLQGGLSTLVDEKGTSHTDVAVLSFTHHYTKAVTTSSDGTTTHLIYGAFVLQDTSV